LPGQCSSFSVWLPTAMRSPLVGREKRPNLPTSLSRRARGCGAKDLARRRAFSPLGAWAARSIAWLFFKRYHHNIPLSHDPNDTAGRCVLQALFLNEIRNIRRRVQKPQYFAVEPAATSEQLVLPLSMKGVPTFSSIVVRGDVRSAGAPSACFPLVDDLGSRNQH